MGIGMLESTTTPISIKEKKNEEENNRWQPHQALNLTGLHFARKALAVDSCGKPFLVSTFRRISRALALYAPGVRMGNSVGKMLAKRARRMAPYPPGFLADVVARHETEE